MSGMGRRDGSGRVAGSQCRLCHQPGTCIKLVEGSVGTSQSALHLGTAGDHQILSSVPGAALEPLPQEAGRAPPHCSAAPRGQAQDGACRPPGTSEGPGPKWTLLTAATAGQCAARAGSLSSEWAEPRQSRRAGRKAGRVGTRVGPGPRRHLAPSQAQARPGLYWRLYRLHGRPYLAREHQRWHLPPRGSDVCGVKGTMWLRTQLTLASPRGRTTHGPNPEKRVRCGR